MKKAKMNAVETPEDDSNNKPKEEPLDYDSIPPDVKEIMNQEITEAVVNELKNKQKMGEIQYEPLKLVASEFLKSFAIIGFGLNGERVYIASATTPEQQYSIIKHLQQITAVLQSNLNNSSSTAIQ
tara:strand:+ start:1741 stop:2118 length:378 start_codon:yes stop_codon:yes gene_type:complete